MDYEWRCNCWFTVQFSLGWNILHGVSHASDCEHHHVLHLTIQRSAYDRLILSALRCLPAYVLVLVRHFWPGYSLPDHVVLKRRKIGWETEFENEKAMYSRLRPLQGDMIPKYYGEARCENIPAIVMENVKGDLPFRQEKPFLSFDEFRQRLEVAYDALRSFGVMTDDNKLANIILVSDKAVFIDLESMWEPEADDWEHFRETSIGALLDEYTFIVPYAPSPVSAKAAPLRQDPSSKTTIRGIDTAAVAPCFRQEYRTRHLLAQCPFLKAQRRRKPWEDRNNMFPVGLEVSYI